MSGKTFLRPGIDPATGAPFRVYLPSRGRDILPDGEAMLVDAYLERRMHAGELVAGEPPAPATRRPRSSPPTDTHPTGD